MKKQAVFLVLITLFICSKAISQSNLNNGECVPLNPENFNKVIDGKQVGLFLLKNANLTAAITNYGGRIVSLCAPDKNGQMADVVLGFKSIDDYLKAIGVYHGAIVGRVIGRIAKGYFELDGKTQSLTINSGANHQHGGLKGFHNQVWDVKTVKDNGAVIKDISLPHTKYALPTYYIIAPAEASSNLARYDGVRYGLRAEGKDLTEMYENTRSKGFGTEVKRRIMIGTYVLSSGYYDAYYLKAQKVRNLIKIDFDNAFKDVDVILTPTTPTAAFKFGENTDDPIAMYLNDIFTVTANLAGLPAISLPIKYNKDGLPLALQLFGKSFDEQTLLNTAYSIEQQVNFKSQVKDWWM